MLRVCIYFFNIIQIMELDPAEKIDMNKEEELISDIDYRKDMVENRRKSSIVV